MQNSNDKPASRRHFVSMGSLAVAALLSGCGTHKKGGTRPVYAQPTVKKKTPVSQKKAAVKREKQIFLVIDDAGQHIRQTQPFLDLPVPMTIAVLPQLKHTDRVVQALNASEDKETILHQPMQPKGSANPGPGVILESMSEAEIRAQLDQNLRSVPNAVGMNNHMGSYLTSCETPMQTVLEFCRERDLFFLDSLTTPDSVVPLLGRQMHMHVEQRDVFLDVEHTAEFVRQQFKQAVRIAERSGYAIVIGHAWCRSTAAELATLIPQAQEYGITFHNLSELYS